MYSGYIDVGKKSGVAGKIHYWFIESQNSPKDDPVVYWTNGGPGGSGISTVSFERGGRRASYEISKNSQVNLSQTYSRASFLGGRKKGTVDGNGGASA